MKTDIVKYTLEFQEKYSRDFDCGNSQINNFLKSNMALDPSFGTTYIWISDDNAEIIGYYNITVNSVRQSDGVLREGGSAHINELGLDNKYRGHTLYDDPPMKFSEALLQDCIGRILRIREQIGFAFITLSSTAEGQHLYEKFDFEYADEDAGLEFDKSDKEKECIDMFLALDLE